MPKRNGPAPQPTEVKRRRGNPGKRALPEPAVLLPAPGAEVVLPEPSRPLGEAGAALWGRSWRHGAAWIAPTDIELLLVVCEALDEREELRRLVGDEGHWRDRAALRAITKEITDGLAQLGFSPADRTRMGVAEVRAVSALEQVRARRAAAVDDG